MHPPPEEFERPAKPNVWKGTTRGEAIFWQIFWWIVFAPAGFVLTVLILGGLLGSKFEYRAKCRLAKTEWEAQRARYQELVAPVLAEAEAITAASVDQAPSPHIG